MKPNPDPVLMRRIAEWYDGAKHEPYSPHISEAYERTILQLWKQFHVLQCGALNTIQGMEDPWSYEDSKALFDDVDRGRLRFLLSWGQLPMDHPMDGSSPFKDCDGCELSCNDVFRVVHDVLGHYRGRNSFGPIGEYRAFLAHCQTLPRYAWPALATETIGQNAWVNYGPYAHLPAKDRPYAEQKACIMPDELLNEAIKPITP